MKVGEKQNTQSTAILIDNFTRQQSETAPTTASAAPLLSRAHEMCSNLPPGKKSCHTECAATFPPSLVACTQNV